MSIIPIDIPAGVFKNGTPYRARQRWSETNLVRWHDGALRAIGGWERRTIPATALPMPALVADPLTEVVRDMLSWTLNVGTAATAFGSNIKLYYMPDTNVPVDITPAGYTGSGPDSTVSTGYGASIYGSGSYGTPRSSDGRVPSPISRWKLDTWGEDLLALGDDGTDISKLYSSSGAQAIPVPNSPEGMADFIVTDQRSVMTVGETDDPRRVRWSDRENRESWTPTTTNEAGGITLSGIGPLLSIVRVLNQNLILSATDAHVSRYIGPPYVYGFDRVGENCEPVHRGAVLATDRFAMWLGRRNFWMYDGTVRKVPCDVMDYIQETANTDAYSKIFSYQTRRYSELTWAYQSKEATEVDSYVSFDYIENHWSVGKLNRTAGYDLGATTTPVMVDEDGLVWNHEIDSILVEGAYATTGPLELSNGAKNMAVRYVLPDTQQVDEVDLTLLGKAMPTDPEYTYGPYTYTNPISTRAMGREIRMRVDLLTNTAEVGTMRFDVAPIGTGFR